MKFPSILKTLAIVCGIATVSATSVAAEQVGYGRLIVNDFLGDGHDRWRSGSIAASHVYGAPWQGALPSSPWENYELRILGQVIAPANLRSPTAGDRPYAAALSLGLHTHFQRNAIEYSMGGDVTVVGPQNGISDFQSWLHDRFGIEGPSDAVLSSQVGNEIAFTGVLEAGRVFALGAKAEARPFIEARAGDETLLRAGVDLTFGTSGPQDLWVRDPISGHRYRTMARQDRGVSFLLGADVAYVDSSIFLPASSGVTVEDTRSRVRAGIHWQGKRHSVFYGASWLSPEFVGQDSGQVVGALRINFDF